MGIRGFPEASHLTSADNLVEFLKFLLVLLFIWWVRRFIDCLLSRSAFALFLFFFIWFKLNIFLPYLNQCNWTSQKGEFFFLNLYA